jgi:hypothetical protein
VIVGIDRHQRCDEDLPQGVPGFIPAPGRRNLLHQTMEADGVGRDRRISSIYNCLAVDEREAS